MSPSRRKPQGNKQPAGKPQQNRRGGGRKPKPPPRPVDLWRPVPQLPDPEPIVPAADPATLLRSLGDPPLPGQGAVAEHYLAAVIERAAGLATALAATAGLLAEPDDE
jgi:hypothetical protein